MPNIVAIVSDDRVRRQVEQFIEQFNSDEIRLVTFKSAKEFEALYFPPLKPASAEAPKPPKAEDEAEDDAKPEEGPVDLRLLSQVHVIIFAIDSIGSKVSPWASSIMKKTKERNYWPENNRTRLLLLKYEDDNISKIDVLLQEIDDLVYLPLDRLIFQQKLEVIMALPKKIKGKFLFSQPIETEIEISKITRLERFCDVGLAVRNPLPIRSGIRAKFYMQLPGDKEIIRFFAKAIRSVPHPEHPEQYLCYFSFFGMRKKEVTKIRQSLSKSPSYKLLLKEDRSRFRMNPSDLMQVEQAGPIRNLVLIDPSDEQLTSISTLIRSELDHVQITTNSSYSSFVHNFLKRAPETEMQVPPKPTRPEEFYGGSMQLVLTMDRRAIKSMNFTPGEEKFFGYVGQDTFKNGGVEWWNLFSTEENDLIFKEAVELLKENKSTSKVIVFRNIEGERFAARLKIEPNKSPDHFNLEILPVNANEMVDALGVSVKIPNLDALVIDTAFIPPNFSEWLDYLKNSAYQRGMLKHPNDLKVILISDREDRLERIWLDSPNVIGFLIKPLDARHLLFLLSEAMKSPFTAYHFENIGWADTSTNIHMSREIHLEAVAEFGATLKSETPFRPGSFFFLRKLIFDNAPNQCLAARVYYCEPHPSDKTQFQISVLYYGINETFLKFARTWIRENYAQSKAQQSG